jgi:hypothetical protein
MLKIVTVTLLNHFATVLRLHSFMMYLPPSYCLRASNSLLHVARHQIDYDDDKILMKITTQRMRFNSSSSTSQTKLHCVASVGMDFHGNTWLQVTSSDMCLL